MVFVTPALQIYAMTRSWRSSRLVIPPLSCSPSLDSAKSIVSLFSDVIEYVCILVLSSVGGKWQCLRSILLDLLVNGEFVEIEDAPRDINYSRSLFPLFLCNTLKHCNNCTLLTDIITTLVFDAPWDSQSGHWIKPVISLIQNLKSDQDTGVNWFAFPIYCTTSSYHLLQYSCDRSQSAGSIISVVRGVGCWDMLFGMGRHDVVCSRLARIYSEERSHSYEDMHQWPALKTIQGQESNYTVLP